MNTRAATCLTSACNIPNAAHGAGHPRALSSSRTSRVAQKIDGSRIGFLATCFLVVCLVGVFASSATPIPYARFLLKEQALDDALATAGKPNQPALLAALGDRLGEQADLVIDGAGPLPRRVAQARTAARAEAMAEGQAEASQMRLLVVVTSIVCAIFGMALSGVGRIR
jgi:hypothetical protein